MLNEVDCGKAMKWEKGRRQRVESRKQQAASSKQQAASSKQQAEERFLASLEMTGAIGERKRESRGRKGRRKMGTEWCVL